MCIFLLGTAGSGKSTTVKALARYLEEEGFSYATVNLDPGAEYLPYKPGYDVRRKVTVRKLMIEKGLGPNSAQIEALKIVSDMIWSFMPEDDVEYCLIDTPGQLEIFAFTSIGPAVTSTIAERHRSAALFLVDATQTASLAEMVFMISMAKAVELRLGIPSIPVVNKSDLLSDEDKRKVEILLSFETEKLKKLIPEETAGIIADIAIGLAEVLSQYRLAARIVSISALNNTGIAEVFDLINETACVCGDLT
ncbi:MAG TPA: hypothetical protein ENF42_00275 [Candidatus Bathyarchaeota archaeon]|nr:hypothetical protein [Candidatus Bathyarchaeota archaeon]